MYTLFKTLYVNFMPNILACKCIVNGDFKKTLSNIEIHIFLPFKIYAAFQ